jgi:multiple sugar transport system ATP-binding protein
MGRALVREPAVFLLDEPLSNLDARLRVQVRAEIEEIQTRTRTTMIYVTHDQVEALTLGDRVAVLDRGRVQQVAPPREIYERPASTFVAGFIGNPPMNLMKAARRSDGRVALGNWGFDAPGGGDILLGVRAEEIEIVAHGAAIDATVKVVEPLGPSQLVTVDVDGQMARVEAPNAANLVMGQKIALKPKPGALRWFSPDGGARV